MHTGPVAREKLFNMRMSEDEWHRLEALAEHYALNAAGVLRMLVKERFDQESEKQLRDAGPHPLERKASKPAKRPHK